MPGVKPEPSWSGVVGWPEEAAARYVARGYWRELPWGDLLYAAADSDPEAVCLVDGPVRLTFRELMSRADGAALRLQAHGLTNDDRIVMQLPNCWQFVVLTIACFRLGVIPVMALPSHRRQEMLAIAGHSQARALFVPDLVRDFNLRELAHRVAADVPTVEHVMVLGEAAGPNDVDLNELCMPADDPVATRTRLDHQPPDPRSVSVFLTSGGTTGLPKLIGRTHNDFSYMASRAAEICDVTREDTYLAALPLGHGFPMSGPGVLGTLLSGGKVVIVPSPAPERAFPAVAEEQVTITSLVPAVIQRWLAYRRKDPGTELGSLRLLQSGAARLSAEAADRVVTELGCTLQQVYGMSEGLLCLTRPDDPEEVIRRSQGRPICPDDELLLVDEAGQPVGPGEPGVLLTRGPYTPRGYYRAPELNTEAFVGDGWYRTGDVVRLRPDGNLLVEGRAKDVINRGGEKIASSELEELAQRVSGVRQAAAVPLPDPELGERVCLYVVTEPDIPVTLGRLREELSRAGLASFKLPDRLELIDELPLGNVGKVDKRALAADLRRRTTMHES